MIKAKFLPAMLSALALISGTAALFAADVGANALSPDLTVATVTEGFVVDNGTLTGFNLPEENATGYFKAVIPDTVTAIAEGAFTASDGSPLAYNFLSVEIPESVNFIAQNAFVNCNGLVEVCFPNAEEIGVEGSGLYDSALSRVTRTADESLHISPDGGDAYLFVRNGGVGSTEWVLLDYCGAATELTLPAPEVCDEDCTAYSVYRNAFSGGAFTSVAVPASVTELGEGAFSDCAELSEITLGEGLITIGSQAFVNTAVTSVNIPASLERVADHAFDGCAALSEVTFAGRTQGITIDRYAFNGCTGLRIIDLPENTTVRQMAFNGCTSLSWVYAGNGTSFLNSGEANNVFFPVNTNLSIVFSSAEDYNRVMNGAQGETFKNNNGSSATYAVNVNCYIGDSTVPVVYRRLHGESFNYVCGENGFWNTDTAYSALPVQAENYSSTVWYGERDLVNKISWERVNELLATQSSIDLYCYRTVNVELPAEPATWVYDGNVSYDIGDLSQVLKALGSEREYTSEQLSALRYEVVYADSNSNVSETPAAISQNGVYSVTVTLNPDYGVWSAPAASTITINVNTSPFNVVLIVLCVIGALAVVVTVSTAVIRKKVLARNKKKQLSSKEVLEKFRALGEETTLQ